MQAFGKGELKYYDDFHKDKNYALEASKLPLTGKTVLEIGSGTGLMTKELRKLGYEVTTVDPNTDADYARFEDVPDPERFDNIIALYDVMNYIPYRQRPDGWITGLIPQDFPSSPWIVETWPRGWVKPFTYKKSGNCHRIRLGIKLFSKAHLLFIYWGKGLTFAYHKLYL